MAKIKSDFLKTIDITLDDFFDGESAILTVREPTTRQMLKLRKASGDENQIADGLYELLPEVVIKHNFVDENEKAIDKKSLCTTLLDKQSVADKIIQEFFAGFFPSVKKSEKK